MSEDRRYKQRGYQEDDRRSSRPPAQGLSPEGRRIPVITAYKETVRLIIFMITTPLLQTGVTVNLPKAKNPLDAPEADAKDAVRVALTREGRVYVDKTPVTEAELLDSLGKKFASGEVNKVIYLKADTAVA